ncbi:DUF3592 domain-containing protein [Kitasatospora viridis]|uniref:DUF3592 domain-containing protein n=1 Tax=Kitasatospora viridis TaxID=281105 RepID=A0A561UIF0_9ACTN|nr:DUF3592 domain-containing protein [Kitasatospora viridis]TWF99161.1 hypothetical protein FHX73_113000 [Kitasatospora viridis]
MDGPTAAVAGGVLVLFGGALLFWCAAELRLRHRLRRRGVPVTALVVPDTVRSQAADPAPLLSYATLPAVGAPGGRHEAGVLLARPRGSTPLSRPAALAPGSSVRVRYDPRDPSLVVLADRDRRDSLPQDAFWPLLGASALAVGLGLLVRLF